MSSGKGEGPIHFVESFNDLSGIPEGAVLVTTSPNPSFSAMYPVLSGLISVTGGALSHGFVSAREYGLPAVSGVHDALTRFESGMRVRLDGSTGIIEVLEQVESL